MNRLVGVGRRMSSVVRIRCLEAGSGCSSAPVLSRDLDAVELERAILVAGRWYHLKRDVVEFSLTPIEGRLEALAVCKLDDLDSPLADAGVLRNQHRHIEGIHRKALVWSNDCLADRGLYSARTGKAELEAL